MEWLEYLLAQSFGHALAAVDHFDCDLVGPRQGNVDVDAACFGVFDGIGQHIRQTLPKALAVDAGKRRHLIVDDHGQA